MMPKQATEGKSEDVATSKEKNDASFEVERKSKDKKKKKSKSINNEDVNDEQDREKLKSLKMDSTKASSDEVTINLDIKEENKPQKRKIGI